jgi:hypothetical protein
LEHKSIINHLNSLVLPISEEYPDFIRYKRDALSLLTHIKELSSYVWLDNEDELEAAEEIIYNQQEQVVYDLNAIVGEANNDLIQAEYAITSAREMQEEIAKKAEEVYDKQEYVSSLKDEAALLEEKLAESKTLLWEKFQPTDEDSAFILWYKAIKFKTVMMYDEGLLCLDKFLEKINENTTPEISPASGERIYNATKAVFEQVAVGTPTDGIIVWGFEDGSTENEFLKVGDIVTHINGVECHRDTDWNDNCVENEPNTFTYLRLNDDNEFETLTFVREKPGDVSIGLLELTEQYDE